MTDSTAPLDTLDRDALLVRASAAEDALAALREDIAASNERRATVVQGAGTLIARGAAGPQLYEASQRLWNAIDEWQRDRRANPWPKAAVRDFSAALLARLTRFGVFAVFLALLPTVFLLIQSLLLNTQNAKFERQNNLLGFQVTSNFRQAFFQAPFDAEFNRIDDYVRALTAEQEGRSEDATTSVIHRWPRPNDSVVSQVANLAQTEADTVASLKPLLNDDAVSVVASTLLVFQQLEGIDLIETPLILTRADLSSANFSDMHLIELELSESFVIGSTFAGSRLPNASFSDANAGAAGFENAELREADFSNAQLHSARFFQAHAQAANFQGAVLEDAELAQANFEGADFRDACLVNTRWLGAHLTAAVFDGANLSGADLGSVIGWESASFKGANVFGLVDPPNGLVDHALDSGALCQSPSDVPNGSAARDLDRAACLASVTSTQQGYENPATQTSQPFTCPNQNLDITKLGKDNAPGSASTTGDRR